MKIMDAKSHTARMNGMRKAVKSGVRNAMRTTPELNITITIAGATTMSTKIMDRKPTEMETTGTMGTGTTETEITAMTTTVAAIKATAKKTITATMAIAIAKA